MATSGGFMLSVETDPYLGDLLTTVKVTNTVTGRSALTTCHANDIVRVSERLDALLRNTKHNPTIGD